jgi:hypothetical protein
VCDPRERGHSLRWAAVPEKTIIIIIIIIIKYNRANAEASNMGAINSSDRVAAILYSLGTWFVSGIYK